MSKHLIVAVKEEVNNVKSINDVDITISGVGKLNAAITTLELIKSGATNIINIGSCGSTKHKIGALLKVNTFYQDIDCTPLCEYGSDLQSSVLSMEGEEISCFSTDTFYDKSKKFLSPDYLNAINTCDCIDMESYAIAKICLKYQIKFDCYKWVSDDGSGGDWLKNKEIGFNKFKEIFNNE